jgi:serine/threonine protein phosphatase 1
MAGRTFAVGDIHGESEHLLRLLQKLPPLDAQDTLVFLGDYLDRGPDSAKVVAGLRGLSEKLRAKVVCLRGNHEDAWLRVLDRGWDEFVFPPRNGCLATLRSFTGGAPPRELEMPQTSEAEAFFSGSFFPPEVVSWLSALPYFYEDQHAIYVHAGLPEGPDGFLHPSKVPDPIVLLWLRTRSFFVDYKGKPVVVGHTVTEDLPQELSHHTPEDPTDLFAGDYVFGLDTGCGGGGFLTALELPSRKVYESRDSVEPTR